MLTQCYRIGPVRRYNGSAKLIRKAGSLVFSPMHRDGRATSGSESSGLAAPSPCEAAFVPATVVHARLRPRQNRFRYRVPYLVLPAGDLTRKRTTGLLSINQANLFSVHARDYGDGQGDPLGNVRGILARASLMEAAGEITLVTMPRILGFGFNPVSFWLCFDADHALRAVVAEVNNTFGERHFYLCGRDDRGRIEAQDRLTAQKAFRVSPFLEVDGEYRFGFAWQEGSLAVQIDLHDAAGVVLTTSLSGRRLKITKARLALALLANPLVMFKVLALIHYQAARLLLKGVGFARRSEPAH